MTWFDWFLCGYWLLNIFLTIAYIGKEREPFTPGVAAFSSALFVALIAVLLVTRGAL